MLAAAAPVLRPTLTRVAIAAFGLGAVAVAVGVPADPPDRERAAGVLERAQRPPDHLLPAGRRRAGGVHVRRPAGPRPAATGPLGRSASPWCLRACRSCGWRRARPGPDDVGSALETAWGFVKPPLDSDVIRLAALIVWLTFAVPAVVLLVLRVRGRIGITAFAVAAIALVTFDLFRIGMGLNPAIDEENARVPVTPAIEYLQDRRPERFVGANKLGILPPLEPNLAMDFDLYDVRGYDFPTEHRHSKLWKEAVFDREGFFIPHHGGSRHRALPARLQPPGGCERHDGARARAGREVAASGLRRSRRARLRERARAPAGVARGRRSPGRRRGRRVRRGARAAVRPAPRGDRRAADPRARRGAAASRRCGSARIVEQEPERVVVEADAGRRALLVLADVHYPAGRRSSTGRRCRSSAWTTCCAVSRSLPASTPSSSATSR